MGTTTSFGTAAGPMDTVQCLPVHGGPPPPVHGQFAYHAFGAFPGWPAQPSVSGQPGVTPPAAQHQEVPAVAEATIGRRRRRKKASHGDGHSADVQSHGPGAAGPHTSAPDASADASRHYRRGPFSPQRRSASS